MPVSGDFLNRRFEKGSFGGYKASDVDSFMAELAIQFTKTDHEIADLKRKLDTAEKKLQQYESEEDSLKNTLLNAQRLADKIVKEARDESESMIKRAQASAEITISDAQIKADKLIDNVQKEIELRKNEAELIKNEVSDFKLNVMRLYKTHLELINEIPSQDDTIEQDAAVSTGEQMQEEEFAVDTPAESEETDANQALNDATVSETQEEAAFEKPQETQEAVMEEPATEQKDETAETEKSAVQDEQSTDTEAAVSQTVKLNLRYNEKTGEYEPINSDSNILTDDGFKFGTDYDIKSDNFNENDGRRRWRR